jgi:alcohol dehydrogenase class IV
MISTINIDIPTTVIGLGAASDIGSDVKKFGAENVLVITDKNLIKAAVVEPILSSLKETSLSNEVYDGCIPEPTIGHIEALCKQVVTGGYDLLIGVGGGSNMDITKVVSILAYSGLKIQDVIGKPGIDISGKVLPKILLPTTSGTGAEWSGVAIIYENNHDDEYMIMTSELLPDKVIIDSELTRNLPAGITADTGFDALTHAIEGYTSRGANVFSDMMAETAIKLVSNDLHKAYTNGQDMEARYNMSLAAALAMNAMATGGLGICHPLNELIQTKAHVSHGKALAVILPSVMEFNMVAIPEKFARIAELLGEDIDGLSTGEAAQRSVVAIRRLIRALSLPEKMRDIGITRNDIPEIAQEAYQTRQTAFRGNPREVTEANLLDIYTAAF